MYFESGLSPLFYEIRDSKPWHFWHLGPDHRRGGHPMRCDSCAQSCQTLCHPMDSSLPGSSIHGIFQARTQEWFAISSSSGDLPNLGIVPLSLVSPALEADSLPHWGSPVRYKVLSSSPDSYSLDASSALPAVKTENVSRRCQVSPEGKSRP